MTVTEAAELLGLAGGTVRGYCRAVGLQKVCGRYDIDPNTVEEWRHNPPEVAALRRVNTRPSRDEFSEHRIKRYISDRVPNVEKARAARRRRLLDAMNKAGI